MKHILIAGVALVIGLGACDRAWSQDSASGAISGSSSNVGVGVNAAAIVEGDVHNYPAQLASTSSRVTGSTTTRIESAPSVQAPAVFGGGHPCLAGKSGGLSVIGGGLSYGQGDAEPICMLLLMGQNEAALRLLATQNRAACQALVNSGAIVSNCGGRSTRRDASVTRSLGFQAEAPAGQWRKCEYDAASNRITWTSKGNRDVSKAACIAHLGF